MNIQVKFKNLDRSELAHEAVVDRISCVGEKFPDLEGAKVVVTLEMENSPIQAGPDLFNVKLFVASGRYRGLTVTRANANLYKALASVVELMLERLNRFGDKERVKERGLARALNSALL